MNTEYVPVSVELLQNLLENSYELRAEWGWKVNSSKSNNRCMAQLDKEIAEVESILQKHKQNE